MCLGEPDYFIESESHAGVHLPIGILSRVVGVLTDRDSCTESHEECRCKHFGNGQTMTTNFTEVIGSGPNAFKSSIRLDIGYPQRTAIAMISPQYLPLL